MNTVEKKRSGRPIPIVGQDPRCDWCRSEGADNLAATEFTFPWGVRVALCGTHLDALIANLTKLQGKFAEMIEAKRREIEASAKPN